MKTTFVNEATAYVDSQGAVDAYGIGRAELVPRDPAEKWCFGAGNGPAPHFAARKDLRRAFPAHLWAQKVSYEAPVSHRCAAARVIGRAPRNLAEKWPWLS